MSRCLRIVLLAGAGIAAGCAGSPQQFDPADVDRWLPLSPPAGARAATTPGNPAGAQADPQPPSGEPGIPQEHPVDLATVLRLCGARNLDVEMARSKAAEAAHRATEADYLFLPVLSPRVAFFRNEGRVQETDGTFLNVDKQNTTAGGAVELVLQPGEALFQSLASRRRADAAASSAAAAVQDTMVAAAQAYFTLAGRSAHIAVAEEDVRFAQELLAIATARREAGAGLAADESRAKAKVAEADEALQRARGEALTASAGLVEILHLDPVLELQPDLAEVAAPIELIASDRDLRNLLTQAFAAHPELRAAGYRVDAAAAEADYTGWGWLVPELRAGASFDGFGPNFGSLEDRDNYYVGIEWRLGLGQTSRHAAAQERLRQGELQQAALRDRIAAIVVRSQVQVRAASARVAAARQGITAAEELVTLVRARHEEGAALLLEVLDAQATLSRARTTLVQAIADHNAAQYALLGALGGR